MKDRRKRSSRKSTTKKKSKRSISKSKFRVNRSLKYSIQKRTQTKWEAKAYLDGRIDGKLTRSRSESLSLERMEECWWSWLQRNRRGAKNWKSWLNLSVQYVRGFEASYGHHSDRLLCPTQKSVAVIVTVMNEETTLPHLLKELDRFSPEELIVVVNGSTDNSFNIASQHPSAKVINYEQALGHDVGRAVGARASASDILLFIDGDITVRAEELLPFIYAVDHGMDIALNDLTPFIGLFHQWDGVSIVKEFLNRSLGRNGLSLNSMTAVPHAMSRLALNTVGIHMLMVPPKAQSIAMMKGLKVGCGGSVNVFQKNRQRDTNQGRSNQVADLIIGDHLEALHAAMLSASPRFGYEDKIRRRSIMNKEG